MKKLGSRSSRCVVRVYGDALEVPPPKQLPRWMIAADYQEQQGTATSGTATPFVNVHHTPRDNFGTYGPMYSFDIDSSMDMYEET